MTAGAIKAKTKRYGLNKINFDFPRWHTYEWDNWDLVDAGLFSLGAIVSSGLWQNSTFYEEGVRVTDIDESITYVSLISHTSPPTGTFGDYRAANPGVWRPVNAVPFYRGEFIYPTQYYAGDIAKKGYAYKLSLGKSESTVDSFVDGEYWATIFDATDVIIRLDQSDANAAHVEELYTDFVSRYLGPYTANPTVDVLGNPVEIGALYWNTTDNAMRVHRGSGIWDEMLDDAPQNGIQYVRQDGAWTPVIAGAQTGTEPPASPMPNSFWWESDTNNLYIRYNDGNSTQWVQIGGGGGSGGVSTTAVLKTGDTMTGPLVLPGSPTLPLQAAPKQYVDAQIAAIPPPADVYTKTESDTRYVNVAGDTMSGAFTVNAPVTASTVQASSLHAYSGDGYGTVYFGTNAGNTWHMQRRPSDGVLLLGYAAGGAYTTPVQIASNGNIWMTWGNDWLSNLIGIKASTNAAPTFTANQLSIQGNSPTLHMRDTDEYGAFLHVNSNLVYFLRQAGANATTWDNGPNNRHPMSLSMTSGDVTFSGNVGAYSDERLKKNVRPITGALDAVLQMEGVWFNKIETGDAGAGVIAQKLQKIAPELVKTDVDGYLSVDYGNLAAYFIEAIKELAKR